MGEVNKLFIIWPFLTLFLKRILNKNTGSNFPHPLVRAVAFFVACPVLKKYMYDSFSFSY